MKIMTFNVQHCYNHMLKEVDYEQLSQAINQVMPDILGINEIYSEQSIYGDQVRKIAELTGFKYYYFAEAFEHKNGPYGNALFTKIPIVNVENIVIPSPEVKQNPRGYYEQRCILFAELADGKRVIVTHFGLNDDEKNNELNILRKYLCNKKTILMGDFNCIPTNPVIATINEFLYDSFNYSSKISNTWPSDNPEVKIDYIFLSNDIKVKESHILDKIISDHLAVVTIIEE